MVIGAVHLMDGIYSFAEGSGSVSDATKASIPKLRIRIVQLPTPARGSRSFEDGGLV